MSHHLCCFREEICKTYWEKYTLLTVRCKKYEPGSHIREKVKLVSGLSNYDTKNN